MPLEKQFLRIPLSAGLDNKTDLRGLQPTASPTLSNCVMLKHGAVRKRHGMASLSKSNLAITGKTLALCVSGGAFKNSSWLTDQLGFYTWSDDGVGWSQEATVPEAVALDRISAESAPPNPTDFDWCYTNGYAFVAFSATGLSLSPSIGYMTALDVSALGAVQQGVTAATVVGANAAFTANGSFATKIVACGTLAVMTYIDGSGNLVATSFDATNPQGGVKLTATLIAAANLSAGTKGGAYDVCPVVGDGTRFILAYCHVTNGFTLASFTASTLAVAVTKTMPAPADATSVACYATNGGFWWGTAANISGAKRQYFAGFWNEGGSALSTTNTAFFTDAATGIPMGKMGLAPANADASGDVVGVIFSSGYASGATAMQSAQTIHTRLTGSGTTYTAQSGAFIYGLQLASRPIWDALNTVGYAALSTPSTLQGTTYLCQLPRWKDTTFNLQTAIPCATLAPRLQKTTPQPHVASGSWSLPHLLPLPTISSLASVAGGLGVQALPVPYNVSAFHVAIALQPLDLFTTGGRASAELGGVLELATGMPGSFDGQAYAENGFMSYPEPTATRVGGGGSLSAGSYQYIVTYEWYDAAGNVHRSATSPAQTITASLNDSATVLVPGVLSRRMLAEGINFANNPTGLVYAIVYRTTANGTTFYRQTADPPPFANGFNSLPANVVASITITDTMSDATLTATATAQLLYTTGGNLDNFNPSSARCLVRHTQRWVLAGCDNPRTVWASKALTDGECPGFNEQLAFLASASVRALASLDDKLILFVQDGARYGVEYVTGQGPLDTGAQPDWSQPIPIPSGGAGAIDQRGTCIGPFGVLFRSPQGGPKGTGGIFLLDRSLQVSYVSGPVEDLLAACPVVTSMVVHPTNGRVYITTITSDSTPAITGGVTRIVWDYLNGGVWSADTVWDTDAAAATLACRAGWVAMAGGIANQPQGQTYWTASATGRAYRESFGFGAASYLDSGSQWIAMSYTSAPLKPATGFARFWRVQLEADSLETHDFTMQLLYDFAPAAYYQESHTWTGPQAATFDRFPQVDVEMIVGNQKAKAIQVVLTDATPTGGGATTGQGPSWATIVVEMGTKPGRYRNIPAAQRS